MEGLQLRDYLRILSKRRWLVALAVIPCAGAAIVATAIATPIYEAEATLFVGQRHFASTEVAEGAQVVRLSQDLLVTYAGILGSRRVAERAVESHELPVAPRDIADHLGAEPIQDTQLIELTYRSPDPVLAQRVVHALARAFVEEVERIETPTTEGAEPAVRAEIVDSALLPNEPVLPRPVWNLSLGLVLGLMLGVGAAFAAEQLDTTIKGRDDVEQGAGVPVLATIPRVETGGANIHLERDPQSAEAEAFRNLRTALQFLGVDRPIRTVLVTSPFAREGKTHTALNLAVAYAHAGMRTILVEADLRRPTLHKIFETDGQTGLTTRLIGRIPLGAAISATTVHDLSYMPAGPLPPNPAELLGSEHMAEVLQALQGQFDLVVIDAPPILPVADAGALAPSVDGVVLVARAGSTSRDGIKEATELTHRASARLLGVVLNYVRIDSTAYGYQYYAYRQQGYRSRASFTTEPEAQPTQRQG